MNKCVVLRFEGDEADCGAAEAALREQCPDVRLTQKTARHLEAQGDDAQLAALQQVAQDGPWSVNPATTADITPPSWNLKTMRARLGRPR